MKNEIPIRNKKNYRDCGGIRIGDKNTYFGKLFRIGSPSSLKQEDLIDLSTLKLKSIFDFREDEDAEGTEKLQKITPVLVKNSIIDNENDHDLKDLDKYYNNIGFDKSFGILLNALVSPDVYPVMIVSNDGIHRSGVALALILLTLGADEYTIKDEFNKWIDIEEDLGEQLITTLLSSIDRRYDNRQKYLEEVFDLTPAKIKLIKNNLLL